MRRDVTFELSVGRLHLDNPATASGEVAGSLLLQFETIAKSSCNIARSGYRMRLVFLMGDVRE